MPQKPAVSLAAVPGRRKATLELAQEIERRGFAGIYTPSFGDGLSHGPTHQLLGVKAGKPLADMRRFVERLRSAPRAGELPPIVLATLRKRMVQLAGEIADGIVWANGARSHMQASLANLPPEKRESFFVGNMIPTCISNDKAAAAAVMRRTLVGYAVLPNYQNYWIEAGYEEEMLALRKAAAAGE